ncbi:MAG: hypothetical protein ABW178_07910 [Pseudoxanthomonas sp.]
MAADQRGHRIERRSISDGEMLSRFAVRGYPPEVMDIAIHLYRASRAGECRPAKCQASGPTLAQVLGRRPQRMRCLIANALRA